MPRQTQKLTALDVKNEKRSGRYGDGLWLQIQSADQKSWLFRYTFERRARDMGLGPYPRVSLADARSKAREQRAVLRSGRDPLAVKRGVPAEVAPKAMTFSKAAEETIASRQDGWDNPKHAAQWRNTLDTYAIPVVGAKAARDVTPDDVLKILRPIWTAKHETASRLRGRLEDVLWYAAVKEKRQSVYANPAVWKGNLYHLLAKPRAVRRVEPHAALPWVRPRRSWGACGARRASAPARWNGPSSRHPGPT